MERNNLRARWFARISVLLSTLFLSLNVHSTTISVIVPTTVRVGDIFDVTIAVSGVNEGSVFPLLSWGLRLGFLTDAWTPYRPNNVAEGYVQGDFGGVGLNTTLFPFYETGTLPQYLTLSQAMMCQNNDCGRAFTQRNEFDLITVRFIATDWCDACGFVLANDITLRDIFNQPISFDFDDGRPSRFPGWTIVSNAVVRVVPEPASLWLLGLGLASLAFTRGRAPGKV